MYQEDVLHQIRTLLSRFQEEVKIDNANGEFSINSHSENVLLTVLNLAYGLNLKNVNYEEGKTYPAIDLRDETNRVAFQITSAGTVEKVVHTLVECIKNNMDGRFDHVYFYFLKGMDNNVSIANRRIKKKLGGFKPEGIHFLDHAAFYRHLNELNDLDMLGQICNYLEKQFGDSSCIRESVIALSGNEMSEQMQKKIARGNDFLNNNKAIQFLKERILQQKHEHPSFRLLANDKYCCADELLFPEAIQLSERYMTYHDEHDKESKPVKLSEFIASSWNQSVNRHLQIQGVGGIGKTVTLLSITTEPGFLPHEVPAIYIPLYELNGYSEEKGIENYLENNIPDYYDFIKSLSTKPWKDGPNLILLLDGFNEIVLRSRKNKVWNDVREWASRSGVQIITTSRSYCGFAEQKFIPITLQKLTEKQVVAYLQKYNCEHINKVAIPTKGDRLLSVLNIPLMLTLYLQIEAIKERQREYPYLEFTESNNSGNLIRNYIQKEILNYSESANGKDIGKFVFSVLAVLPYIMYKMERAGIFSITEEQFKKLIIDAIQYYLVEPYYVPDQVRKAQRGKTLKLKELDEDEVFLNLVEKSSIVVLSTGKDYVDVYRPMHQDFRDGLASYFLCNVGLGESITAGRLPKEYQEAQRDNIVRFMSEILEQGETKQLWENNRLTKPTNSNATRLLLDILGRKNGFDYADVNFSGMDLSNISLYSFLDNHPGLPRNTGAFRKTKLSEKTFIPIGHSKGVSCVATNYYGDRIISGSFDKTLRIWDLDSGECKYTLRGHSGDVRAISVSNNGKILSGADDRTLRLWDIDTGEFIEEYKGHNGAIRSVCIGSNGKWALSGSYDKTVRIWDFESNRSQIIGHHLYKITSISIYEPKSIAVCGDAGGCLSIIDIKSEIQTDLIRCGKGRVIGAYFINNGKSIVSGTSSGDFNIWSIESGKFILKKNVEHSLKGALTCFSVSPDENNVLVGTYHWNLYLLEIESGRCLRVFERHTNRISGLAMCENDGRVISSSWDGTIRVWDMSTAECYTLGLQKNCLTSLSISGDGEHIISGFRNGAVSIWDARKGICKRYFREANSSILSVSIDEKGKSAVSGAWNGNVRLWDIETGENKILDDELSDGLGIVHNSVGAVSISANGKYVLIGKRNKKLYLWEKETNKIVDLMKNQPKRMLSVSLDATGEKAASVDWHGTLYLWNMQESDNVTPKRIKRDEDQPSSVMIDYGGRYVVTGSYNRLISLFDTHIKADNQCIAQIGKGKQYTGRVNSVAISADGGTILSGSREKNMCVWNKESGERRYPPQKHIGRVISVAISKDGKTAVSGDTNDDIYCWFFADNISRYIIRPFVDYDLIGVDLREAEFDSSELKERCRQNGAIV